MTTIYIPTFRRLDRQITWSKISPRWRARTFLVAVPEEVQPLRERGYNVVECPAEGIGPTRQWVLENHDRELLGDHIIMMDDDLRFYKRREDEPTKFWQINDDWDTFDQMMEEFIALFNASPLIGISNRSGANRDTSDLRMNVRMHDLLGIDLRVVEEHDFRIDRIRFMEDFDFILQFLTSGYETVMMNTHCKGDYGSNADGGCSEYRDLAGQAQAALDLAVTWPDFVKLRKVKAKGEGEWAERTDVTVQWGKAAKSALLPKKDEVEFLL